jgi:hypothetical protein
VGMNPRPQPHLPCRRWPRVRSRWCCWRCCPNPPRCYPPPLITPL